MVRCGTEKNRTHLRGGERPHDTVKRVGVFKGPSWHDGIIADMGYRMTSAGLACSAHLRVTCAMTIPGQQLDVWDIELPHCPSSLCF